MKKYLLIIFVFIILFSGCKHIETKRSLSEDLGSPEKIALLRERANDFWSAYVKEDYKTIYNIFDPFFRAKTDLQSFYSLIGKVKYYNYEIEEVNVEGNIGTVKVKIVYSLPKVVFKKLEFKESENTTEFEETWLYIYDNWYKEFYLHSLEQGIAVY